jgi:regulatory protein
LLNLKRKPLGSKRSKSNDDALQRALRFLSYRSRSQAEVRRKLTQFGYSGVVTERTLEKLRDLSYVNDEAFARSWAQSRAESRAYGAKRVEQELKSKGVAAPLTRQAVREAFGRESEKENAKKLLERRFREKSLSHPKILRRAIALLERRGFSSEVIFALLRRPGEED